MSVDNLNSNEFLQPKEIFEPEKRYRGKYPSRVISYMKKEIFRAISISTDPHVQGQYMLDRRRLWYIYKNYDRDTYKKAKYAIVRHTESIDFKDGRGVERLKLARQNLKIPATLDGLLTQDEYALRGESYYFSQSGAEKLIAHLPLVELGDNLYQLDLPTTSEIFTNALSVMPGEDLAEQLDNFCKLMRMEPQGVVKSDKLLFHEDAKLLDQPKEQVSNTQICTDEELERMNPTKRPKAQKKTTRPTTLKEEHQRYLLRDDGKTSKKYTRKGYIPYFTHGSLFNGVTRQPPETEILAPVRPVLKRIEE